MDNFDITIVTPERVTFQGKADALILPAWEGSMGILAGHQSALVLLQPGVISFREGETEKLLSVSGGFAEIHPKKVILFAETAELAEEIDEERAKLAANRAKETISGARQKKKGYEDIDVEKAQATLRKALVRTKAASLGRRKPYGRVTAPPPVANQD